MTIKTCPAGGMVAAKQRPAAKRSRRVRHFLTIWMMLLLGTVLIQNRPELFLGQEKAISDLTEER